MKRTLIIIVSTLCLIAWAYPQSIQAAQAQIQFNIDPSLNQPKVLYAPYPQELAQAQETRNRSVSRTTTATSKIGRTKTLSTTKRTQTGYNACSCVSYARYITGINVGPIGLAKNHPINSRTPSIGSLVITNEGTKTGHLAAVIGVTETTITIKEANYARCRIGTRTLHRSDPRIRGYYNLS